MRKTRIISVVKELVHTKTPGKLGTMLTDSTQYQQSQEFHSALAPGCKTGAELTPEAEEILNKKQAQKIQKKYDEKKKNAQIISLLEESSSRANFLHPSLCDQANMAKQMVGC